MRDGVCQLQDLAAPQLLGSALGAAHFLDRSLAVLDSPRWMCVQSQNILTLQQCSLQDLAAPAPQHLGSVLGAAHFLDRMLATRPARSADAPAWFESAAALLRRLLANLTQDAPQVTSTVVITADSSALV